jgi:hypothetical protein
MLFFTASGSRRSYYVLPLVPFAQLLGAWWITRRMAERNATGTFASRGLRIGFGLSAVALMAVLGVLYPWTNSGGGVVGFGDTVKLEASKRAPLNHWRMVMIDVDNKVPLYLQTGGPAFFYVQQTEDFPRTGDTAALMAWLDRTSGQHWNPQRTIVVAQYRNGDALPLNYLSADHQVITTTPTNGERLFHAREDQSVAFIPEPSTTKN